MKQRIIVFAGYAGSGKDTAGEVLTRNGYKRAPLAGPLKDMLRCFLRMRDYQPAIIERMLEGDLKEQITPAFDDNSPRKAMQLLGTEWGRALSSKLWLNTWEIMHTGEPLLVVTDCRFKNEAQFLSSLGAEIYWIKRPGFQQRMNHASEDLSWAEGLEVIWNDTPTAVDFQINIERKFF
jgi:hypothetical protein